MIPFRTQRLATSVVNRIMNVYAGINPPPQSGAPSAPEAPALGAPLDAALTSRQAPVDASPDTAEDVSLTAGGLI